MSKYFIAVVPPSPLQEEIMEIKKYFAEHYSSEGALRSPAHITLHMPFELEGEKEKKFLAAFKSFSPGIAPFNISLNGFSCFEPRVIFIGMEHCETLKTLQSKIVELMKTQFNIFNQSDDLRGFHPHITVAFRDLKKPKFLEAWKEFESKKFSAGFICEGVSLLRHEGQRWEVCLNTPFSKTNANNADPGE